MIRTENLDKSFGKLRVLKNINLEFRAGEVITLIGPNGSGKTTLIKILLGLVIPDAGRVLLNDRDVIGSWDYRKNIGYMPQIGRFPDQMKIRQVFSMMQDIRIPGGEVDRELMEQFNMSLWMEKRMGTLSGGTRQKVSASLAFLFDPQVLILDEPTSGLDPLAAEFLKNKILKERGRGKITLITTHNMSEVEELADRVLFIVDGEIRFNKTVEEIRSETKELKIGKALAKLMNGVHHA